MWDFDRAFDYENGFYLTASVGRISKFVTHLDLFRMAQTVPGEIVECGVFKGVSLSRWIKLRALLENETSRRIIGFDTFGSFPEADYAPDHVTRQRFVEAAGDQSIRVADMRATLEHLGLATNVELVEGDILNTVPAYVAARPELRIALLHIDVDLLEPTRVCLEHLWPHVSRGGIIVLDDYGAFAGANKAVDDFLPPGVRVHKLPYTKDICYAIKP